MGNRSLLTIVIIFEVILHALFKIDNHMCSISKMSSCHLANVARLRSVLLQADTETLIHAFENSLRIFAIPCVLVLDALLIDSR